MQLSVQAIKAILPYNNMQQAFHKHMYEWVWVTPSVDFGTNKVNGDTEIMYKVNIDTILLSNMGKQCTRQMLRRGD